MKTIKLRSLLFSACGLWLTGAAAEDIDLFQADPSITGAPPNILFMIDNSANWNATIGSYTKNQLVHEALYGVVTDPDWIGEAENPQMRVGLMHFAKSNSPKGGKVVNAVEPLTTTLSDSYKSQLYQNSVVEYGKEQLEKTNNAPYALMINEAYRYFSGSEPRAGTADGDHDPNAIAENGNYLSPTLDNACGKNFVILIGNGEPDSGEDGDAEAELRALGGVYPNDPIGITPDNFESNWSDEFARYLAGSDVDSVRDGNQGVITYVIDVHDPDSNQANTKKFKGARSWLKSIALRGDGRYFTAQTADQIQAAMDEILDEIQAVNSVFASTTLPVSVNVRGTNLNQVYIGVFRPDAQNRPRWMGNLKLYQLGVDQATETVFLADANGERAESQATGFINSSAVSYWTHDSTYWGFDPRGTPPSSSDSPDGEVVEKGGAAQQLRDDYLLGRTLYTCTGGCGAGSALSGTVFNSSNADIDAAALGVADADERIALIDWIRGEDNLEDENGDSSMEDVRSTVHGDVLHSRPAVINYNRDGTDDDIVVFYGSNDGVFHALEGGKNADDGHALWGFVPEEFFGKLKQLRDNTSLSDSGERKPYFVDGSIGVYRHDANDDGKLVAADGDKVHIYLSMRRGGRLIYALDVSDPETPRLLWKRSHEDTGWAELGQTWSEPRVARIAYDGGTDVLIFGAGYDPAADDQLPAGTHSQGRGIMIVNAHTGELIWQAGPEPEGALYNSTVEEMQHSIPSTVTVIDRNRGYNGFADRLYVGDTGGNVWRVDIADDDPDAWRVHRLADVGGADADDQRAFLYPPDVVYTDDGFDAVLMGTGQREHPFDETVVNRFYMFKDRATSAAIAESIDTLVEDDLYDATENLIQVGTDAEQTTAAAALAGAEGWYITLGEGEKVVGSAVTLSGTTFFNTNQPRPADAGSCVSNLGTARNYMVSFEDGSATIENNGVSGLTTMDRARQVPGGGYPPSPVPVIVEIDGKKYQAVISGTQVAQAPGAKLETRRRSFWYKEVDE